MKIILLFTLLLASSCTESNPSKKETKDVNTSEGLNRFLEGKPLNSYGEVLESPKSETEEKAIKIVKLPDVVIKTVLTGSMMTRDSGKPLSKEYLESCVEDHTNTYFKFYCDDLLWPYELVFIGNDFIYYIEHGASVENRELFKIESGNPKKIDDPLPKILTYEKIAMMIKKAFPESDFSVDRLKMIAHSRFRLEPNKSKPEELTILSGELGANSEYGYKPIGKATWNGSTFVVK